MHFVYFTLLDYTLLPPLLHLVSRFSLVPGGCATNVHEMKLKRKASSSRMSTEALIQEYTYFSELLTNDNSTKMAQASSVNYFRRLFTENTEPPRYFDQSLIDIFIAIVRDTEAAVDVRTDAAWAITNLLCSKRNPLTHTIVDKGTLDVFVWCIATADHKLRDQCIWGVGNISADCPDCKEAVRATDVLETIARQMNTNAFHSLESNRCAIWCCLNILRGGNAALLPRTARSLLTAVSKAMRRLESDASIMQDSLLTLSLLADDRNFLHFPHMWPAQIDAMLNEAGLVTSTMGAIASGNPVLVSPALRLIGNIITGTDDQTERVIMRDGFVPLIAGCMDSAVGQVRREAAWILSNVAAGPAHHVDLIITNKQLIAQLLRKLHMDDPRMQKEVCWVFANTLSNLNTNPRPAVLSEFLGYGVLAIVDFASKSSTDPRLVNKIREVLSAILIVHPEFWCVVEKASIDLPRSIDWGHGSTVVQIDIAGAGGTPLLEVPRRKRRVADYVIWDEDATEI